MPRRTIFLFLFACLSAQAETVIFSGSGQEAAELKSRVILRTAEPFAPVEIDFSLPSMEVTRGEAGFSQLSVKGLYPYSLAGNPDVFTIGSLIAVPDGFEPELKVIEEREERLTNLQVKPSQKQFRCDCAIPFAFNSALYRSDEMYPRQSAKLEEVGKLQSLKLTRIGLYPVRVDLKHHEVVVTTEMKVRVTFRKVGVTSPLNFSPAIEKLARAVAANGAQLEVSPTRPRQETILILVADKLWEATQPLVKWEQDKGLDVVAVRFSEAGGTREKVKDYLQKYYDDHAAKPTYLLIVGNGTDVPPYKEAVTTSPESEAATDLTYALLSGSDLVPDVLYGRIVADNAEEARKQIDRWIAYEKRPPSPVRKGSTIASNGSQPGGPSDEGYAAAVKDILMKHGYQSVDLFYQAKHTAKVKDVIAALEDGRTWFTYFGHGSGTSWVNTNGRFDVSTVQNLTPAAQLPVLIDVACSNGGYTKHATPFGKAWVTREKDGKAGGALAYYGGTVDISWHPPAIMAVGAAKAQFEQGLSSLGASVISGQLYLVEKQGPNANAFDNLKWYTLFGDPSLALH